MSDDTVTQNPQDADAPMLTLVADVSDEGTAAATLPIRWSLSPRLITKIEQEGYTNPHLVIVTRTKESAYTSYADPTYEQTGLQVVPLTREMVFVTFIRPGANEVRAVVVDLPNANAWHLLKEGEVFNCYSGYYMKEYRVPHISGSIMALQVNVPREFFAKEPPVWIRKFLGNFFERKPVDQCHNRRRMILAFGLFAPLSLALLPFRLFLGVISLLRFPREMKWRGLLPFNFNDLPIGKGGSRWYTKPKKYGDTTADPMRLPLWVCNPLSLLVAPVAVFAVGNLFHEHHGSSKEMYPVLGWGFWHTVWAVDHAIVEIALVLCAQVAFVLLVRWIINLATGKFRTKREARTRQRRITRTGHKQQKEQERTKQMLAALAEMTRPSPDNFVSDVRALPPGKQTLSLRFAALKAQVCKPFAR